MITEKKFIKLLEKYYIKTFLMNQIVDSNELAKAIANKIVLVLHSNNQDVCVTKKHFRFFVTDSAPT